MAPGARASASSSGRHEPRPDRGREVLALGRPEADRGLVALQVARRPVVQDEVAADRLLGPLRRQIAHRRVDERARPPARSRAPASRPAPRPGPPGRGSPTCWRSRRSAGGTRPPGSRRRAAPTSSGRGARRRRSRATRAVAGSADRIARSRGVEHGVVDVGAAVQPKPSTRSRQRVDPKAPGEVVVEGRDRLPVERRVVGQRAASPATARRRAISRSSQWLDDAIERRRRAAMARRRGVSLPDVGESHERLGRGCHLSPA